MAWSIQVDGGGGIVGGRIVRIVSSDVRQSVAFLRARALAHDVYVFGVARPVVADEAHFSSLAFSRVAAAGTTTANALGHLQWLPGSASILGVVFPYLLLTASWS